MQRLAIVVFLVIIMPWAYGQPPERFIKYYQPFPLFTGQSYGVAETSYGYLVSGISYDTLQGSTFLAHTLMGIDLMGNQLWQKKYGGPDFDFYGGSLIMDWIRKYGSEYYSLNLIDESSTQTAVILMCFTETGDTLWSRRIYGDSLDSIINIRNLSRCSNGDFLISGTTFSPNSDDKLLLIRTDSTGSEIWRRKYSVFINNAEELNYTLQDDSTKNYYMLARYGNPSIGWLYIADSSGNIFSQKNLSGPNGGVLNGLRQLSNGDFIASGVRSTGESPGGFTKRKALLVRFDRNGDALWTRVYGDEALANDFRALEILPGDTIVAAGSYDPLYGQGAGYNSMYRVVKVTPDGDLIWERLIDLTVNNQNFDILRGMTLTSDGGFALTGYFPVNPAPQPFVLVKLDAYGCDTLNCQYVGLNELESNGLSLYPNPASTILWFKITGNHRLRSFEVYSTDGRPVKSGLLQDQNSSMDVSDLSSGLYLVKITADKGHQWTGRFMVVR